ncbi:hypothetical protein GCM10027047_04420 [Rhodococcus aerolatus]
MRPVDVLAFTAELGVYVAAGWWGATRVLPVPLRALLATVLVVTLAAAWGLLASPRAPWPLTGAASVAFRVGWFGLGAAALLALLLQG